MVAREYVDQLTRSKAFQPERARTLTAALKRVDQLRSGRERGAAALLDQLDAQAVELEREAGTAEARDAVRLRASPPPPSKGAPLPFVFFFSD